MELTVHSIRRIGGTDLIRYVSRVRSCMVLPLLLMSIANPLAGQRPVPVDTAALRQQMQQQLGQQVSHAQLIERLRQSGMSRAEVRDRLRQAGQDPALADQYFDVLERGGEPGRGAADDEFVRALQRIGISIPGVPPLPTDSLGRPLPDSLLMLPDTLDEADTGELQVFGREFFRRDPWQMMQPPETFGPVDRDYRLGPGDELFLVLTGDVELAYTLGVTREGFVIIPDVGQVSVNGLTMAMLEDRLYDRLGRVYSGVSRSANATTQFQVSLGRLRSNQIFVVGDVVDPGAKQISSVGRVLNALQAAGGPTEQGSFRRIEVRRGSQLVGSVDLYDYLLAGDASSDIRLEHGDRVFVPPAGPQATVQGAVRRPAIYEVRPGEEGLADVLAFAGGLEANAVVRRIQIDRILPPEERTSGRYRVLRDADLVALFERNEFIPIRDGDVITVSAIPDDVVRDRLWLSGAVNNPGLFEWSPGMRLSELIARADGLADPAYEPRLQIYRLDPATGERSMLRATAPSAGGTDPILADGDSVVVLSRVELANPSFVSIDGFVKTPGEYGFADGMTLRDLVLAADGFIPGANVAEAEVSRLTNPFSRTDTTAILVRVPLGADTTDLGYLGAGEWPPNTPDLTLERGDRVIIRRAPGYEPLGQVAITGEVLYPGAYVLSSRQERVVDVLRRAGWLTTEAHEEGIRVIRRGTIVAADIEQALHDPSHRSNIRLEPGDSVHVSAFDPTVNVVGAVTFASRVLYRPGRDLDYYLNQAGGTLDIAAKDRITVTYPNGQRAGIRELLWFDRKPDVLPGSTIFVPEKPEDERDGFQLDQFLTRTLTIVSTVVTLLVAIDRM